MPLLAVAVEGQFTDGDRVQPKFGPEQVDVIKEEELCVPSSVAE